MRSLIVQAVRAAPAAALIHVVLAIVAAATVVIEPAALANATNAVIAGRPVGGAWLLLAAVLLGGLLARTTGGLAGQVVDIRATRMLRGRLLRHALRLSTPHQQPFATGDLVSRVSMDASMPGALLPVAVEFTLSAVSALGGGIALFLIDWPTALVLIVGATTATFIIRSFVSTMAQPIADYQRARGALAARLLDACRGVRTIRASGTIDQEVDRVLRPLGDMHAAADQQWQAQRRLVFRISLMHPTLQALVLAVAGVRVAGGHLAPGDLLAVLGYSGLILSILDQVDSVGEAMYVRSATRRVHDVLSHPQPLPEPPHPAILGTGRGSLRLESVSLRVGDHHVIDKVTLEIPAGAHLAVVGRSGAGKSSLCALAGRLVDPDTGTVRLGGIDLRSVRSTDIRQHVTYAFEKPELFGRTIEDALAAGRTEASTDRITAAAVAARADGFIGRLPLGYRTPLAGLTLSGGEIQRLGIARALVGDSSLIVLDDATSSVDTATEADLFAAIREAWTGRTALLVAHRLITAMEADLVAWLDHGRLRSVGPHQDLWRDPDYRALFGHTAQPVAAEATR